MTLYHKYMQEMFYVFIEQELKKGRTLKNIIQSLIDKRKRRKIRPSRMFDKVLNEIARDFLGTKQAIRRVTKCQGMTICLNRMTNVPNEVVSLIQGLKDIGQFQKFAIEALREKIYFK